MLYAVISVIEEYAILLWVAPSWYFFPTAPFS